MSFIGFVVQIVGVSAGFFDRYMLPCIPFALILLSGRSSVGVYRPVRASLHLIAWLLVAISAAFSFASTHDYLA